MDNQEAENTLKEILEEDKIEVKKKKRGRGCFLRLLLIVTLVFICIYGFILIRQKLLDLEAQAIISARQTATAAVSAPVDSAVDVAEQPEASADAAVQTYSATPDPMLQRTSTIAAQLTSVAEFQSSVTPEP
jgi:cytoskeletal protein RodZ